MGGSWAWSSSPKLLACQWQRDRSAVAAVEELFMVSELKRAALPAVIGLIGVAVYTLLQVTAPQPAPS